MSGGCNKKKMLLLLLLLLLLTMQRYERFDFVSDDRNHRSKGNYSMRIRVLVAVGATDACERKLNVCCRRLSMISHLTSANLSG